MTSWRNPHARDLSWTTLRSGHGPVARTLTCALLSLALGACAKRMPEGATMPADANEGAPADIDAIEARLAAHEAQLRAHGVSPSRQTAEGAADRQKAESADEARYAGEPTATAPAAASGGAGPTHRCETICDLSTAICQLRDNICALAPRHPDEPRYQVACQRAAEDCTIATEACHACG